MQLNRRDEVLWRKLVYLVGTELLNGGDDDLDQGEQREMKVIVATEADSEDDAVNGDDDGEDGTAAGTEEMTLR